MRIRKRFPPSSLSSLPLSDPQLSRSPVVQQHIQEGSTDSQPSDPPNQPPPPPSKQHPTIGSESSRWVCSDTTKTQEVKHKVVIVQELEGEEVREERWGHWGEEEKSTNDTRKGSILGAEVGTGLLPPSGSSHQEVGRWCEGDKVVPLKKRRGSFERRGYQDAITEKEKKTKAKMKSKTNKKCVQLNGDEGVKETKEGFENAGSVKKLKRGNVIMEGSRCSRVNGRGWRCCQQTLVGYSLCEHHLGKGRLRSMTSVRNRAMAATTSALKKEDSEQLSNSSNLVQEKQQGQSFLDEDDEDDDEDDVVKKPLMITKKRMKLGMVKARSLRSLLGQPNNAVAVADNNKNSSV